MEDFLFELCKNTLVTPDLISKIRLKRFYRFWKKRHPEEWERIPRKSRTPYRYPSWQADYKGWFSEGERQFVFDVDYLRRRQERFPIVTCHYREGKWIADNLECDVQLGDTPLMMGAPYPDEYPLLGILPLMPAFNFSVIDGNHRMYSRSKLYGISSFPCYVVPREEIVLSVEKDVNKKAFAFLCDLDCISCRGRLVKKELYAFRKDRPSFIK